MARRLSRQHRHHEEPTVNLTPLIDVVFVILIMFIVLAPLLELEHIDLAAAPSNGSGKAVSVQEASPLSLHVQRDNSVLLNRTPIALKELPSQLKEAKKRYPGLRLQLFHDQGAFFGTYQSVKNAAEEAGFEELDLILKPS